MAERIAEFPTRPRNTRYPWDEWTDGKVWKLRAGEDFAIPDRVDKDGRTVTGADQFRNRLYTQAARRQLNVTTQKGRDEDGTEFLILQFWSPSGLA